MAKITNFNDLIIDNIVAVMKDTIYLKGKNNTLLEDAVNWAKNEARNDWAFKATAFPQYQNKDLVIRNAVVELFKIQRINEFLSTGCAPLNLDDLTAKLDEIATLTEGFEGAYKTLFVEYADKILYNFVVRFKEFGEDFDGVKMAYAILNLNYVAKDYLKENYSIVVKNFAALSDEELKNQLIASIKIKTETNASKQAEDDFIATINTPLPTPIEIEPISEESIEELVIEEPVEEEVVEVVEEINVIFSDEEIDKELDDETIKYATIPTPPQDEEVVEEEATEEIVEEVVETVEEPTIEEVAEEITTSDETNEEVIEEVNEPIIEEKPVITDETIALNTIKGIANETGKTDVEKFDEIAKIYLDLRNANKTVTKKFAIKSLKIFDKICITKYKGVEAEYVKQQKFVDDVRLDCSKTPKHRYLKVSV